MFCTNCGCRIPAKAIKCPECNAEVSKMEYCSGFWLELNQNSLSNEKADQYKEKVEADNDNKEELVVETKPANAAGENNKNGQFWKKVVKAEAAVIVILLLYSTISGAVLKKEINKGKDNYAELESRFAELNENYESTKKNYEGLLNEQPEVSIEEYESTIADLEKEKNDLSEENKKLEEEKEQLQEELESLRSQNEEEINTENDEEDESSAVSNIQEVENTQSDQDNLPSEPEQQKDPDSLKGQGKSVAPKSNKSR